MILPLNLFLARQHVKDHFFILIQVLYIVIILLLSK